jgi:hypothetical protein
VFTSVEWRVFIVASVGCIIGIYGLATGNIAVSVKLARFS